MHRCSVTLPLFFKPRQRPQTRSIPPGFEKSTPGTGQLEQPDGVAGRCSVKQNMVVTPGQVIIGQQCRELVKGSDFRGAGAG